MSERIVAKRFALKFSPRPTIALEYQKSAVPDSGLSTMKVRIEQLAPATYDVQGVVDALQERYPRHLGSDVINILQLERLVSILLVRGREDLPEAYRSVAEPSLDEPPEPPAQTASLLGKPPSLSELLGDDAGTPGCLSSGPTPAPTPDLKRVTSAQSDEGSSVSDSGSHGPEGDVGGRVDGAASADCKLDEEERPMATLSTALEGVRLSAPMEELLPQLRKYSDDDAERRQREIDDDLSREKKKGTVKPPPPVGFVHSDARDTTTMDGESEVSVNREEKEVAAKDGHSDDGDSDDGDGGGTIARAPPASTTGAVDVDAAIDEASGQGRPESRQKNNGNEEEEEEEQDKKCDEDEGVKEEDVKEEVRDGLDEVTEMLEILDSEGSMESEDSGIQEASGGQRKEVGTDDEIVLSSVRGEERKTNPYVSSNAAAAEGATIATTAGGIVNDSGFDTARQGTESLNVVGQAGSDDSTGKSPLNMKRSTLLSGIRGFGHTDDEIIADIEVPGPEDQGTTAAKRSASPSPPRLLPTSVPSVLGPPRSRSLSPSSLLPGMGASGASSFAGLPLPPVSGGRPRFGLLGSLPPVGGRGLPSLALRSGVGIGEAKTVADSSDFTAVSGADRSDHNNSAPPSPPLPPPAVFGSPARTEESLSPSRDARLSRLAAPREYTGSADSTRLSPILGGAPAGSRGERAAAGKLGLGGSDPQGDEDVKDVEGSTTKPAAPPRSPRQHQGQEEEDAGAGSTADPPRGLDRATVSGETAEGEGHAGGGEGSGGYFGDSGGEVSEEEIPEVSSGDDDISFEQDSSDGGSGGDGAGAGGDDDYFS